MGVALLDLVETALRVAKQALGKRAGKPISGLAREAHVVVHVVRKKEGHSYAELVDRLSLMPDMCDRLGISSALLNPQNSAVFQVILTQFSRQHSGPSAEIPTQSGETRPKSQRSTFKTSRLAAVIKELTPNPYAVGGFNKAVQTDRNGSKSGDVRSLSNLERYDINRRLYIEMSKRDSHRATLKRYL